MFAPSYSNCFVRWRLLVVGLLVPHTNKIRTEKNLLEHKDKIPEEVKADVQKAIDELKAVMESEDAEDIKEKVQALQVCILYTHRRTSCRHLTLVRS